MRPGKLLRRALHNSIRYVILNPWSTLLILALLGGLLYTSTWRLTPVPYVPQAALEPRAVDVSGSSELTVVGLGQDNASGRNILIMKEKDSNRYLPVWIRTTEAFAIATELDKTPVPRPMTHDLLKSAIGVLGGRVVRVVVTDFSDDTFYARVLLEQDDAKEVELDARPSDAVALALRVGAPIYADASLLDQKGIDYAQD